MNEFEDQLTENARLFPFPATPDLEVPMIGEVIMTPTLVHPTRSYFLPAALAAALSLILFVALLVATLNRDQVAAPAEIQILTPTPAPISAMALEPISAENIHRLERLGTYGNGSISFLDWSKDGQWLAASGSRGIWLYEADNLTKEPVLLAEPGVGISSITFSPDGRLIAGVDYAGNQLVIWDVQTRQIQKYLSSEAGQLGNPAFSADGKFLAATFLREDMFSSEIVIWEVPADPADAYLTVWHYQTEEVVHMLAFHPDNHHMLAYGHAAPPDGRPSPTSVTLINFETEEITPLVIGTGYISNISFSVDGTWLVGVGQKSAFIWNATTGEEIHRLVRIPDRTVAAQIDPVVSEIAITPDKQYVLMPTANFGMVRWRVGEENAEILQGTGKVYGWDMALSPDGHTVAVIDAGSQIHFWEVESGELTHQLQDFHNGFASLSPDGQLVAIGNTDSTLRLLDTTTGQEIRNWTLQVPGTASGDFESMPVFSPDSHWLVGYSESPAGRLLGVWNRTTDDFQSYPLDDFRPIYIYFLEMAFIPDEQGNWLLALGTDELGRIALVDLTSGEVVDILDNTRYPVVDSDINQWRYRPVLHYADNRLTLLRFDGIVETWDVANRRSIAAFDMPDVRGNDIWSAAINAGGNVLASYTDNQTPVLIDLATGEVMQSFSMEAPIEQWDNIWLNADASLLIISTRDEVLAWDTRTGEQIEIPAPLAENRVVFQNGSTDKWFMTIEYSGGFDLWGVPQ